MKKPRFTEKVILPVSKTTLAAAREHQADLSRFGATVEQLDDLESRIQAAESVTIDSVNVLGQKQSTGQKNVALEACYDWARDLAFRMELAFGKSSVEYRAFPSGALNDAKTSERSMIALMPALIRFATDHHAVLSAKGQTDAIRDTGATLLAALKSANEAQEMQKLLRTSDTQDRYNRLKSIYETVNKINRIGQRVYRDNPAKFALFKSRWPKYVPVEKVEE